MNEMDDQLQAYLTEKFGAFLSEERKLAIDHVLNNRTNHLHVVLEDLIDSHNINAIFRSGECLGVQNYHVIDNHKHFQVGKGVTKGSSKWIDIHRYNEAKVDNSLIAAQKLKAKGYKIIVTTPTKDATPIDKLNVTEPLALILGNESLGVSHSLRNQADHFVSIPTYGFTESFNVSVAGAILIHDLIGKIHKEAVDWGLKEVEKCKYRYLWYKKSMARPDYYQKYYVNAYKMNQNV